MILNQIIENKRQEVKRAKEKKPLEALKEEAERSRSGSKQGYFKSEISKPHKIHLIAEIKKASPSAGIIREDFRAEEIASLYETNGASAISVVTDEHFFMGSLSYIPLVKRRVSIPVLRKEFLIDEYQIYESVAAGSDAALLIATLLSKEELRRYLDIGAEYGLDFLVEVHSEEDTEKAMAAGARIIGVNNRDLRNFKVDIKATPRLLKLIPDGIVTVSESGIHKAEDILYLRSLGINAVLIGEALMASKDIAAKIKELFPS